MLRVDCGNGGFLALTMENAHAPASATLTFDLDGVTARNFPVNCNDNGYCSIETGAEGSLDLIPSR